MKSPPGTAAVADHRHHNRTDQSGNRRLDEPAPSAVQECCASL